MAVPGGPIPRRLALGVVALSLAAALAHAATPEEAPPASRAQVQAALKALEPFYEKVSRTLARGQRGTLEAAVAAYAPGTFRPVDEGALPARVPAARCPSDMANVDGRFCIDRYEGSLVVQREGAPLEPWPATTPPPSPPIPGQVLVARSVAGVVPQAYISAAQGADACAAVGKRLCLPVEWRAACGGSRGTAYPYGPTHVANRCHDTGVAPMLIFYAAQLKKGWGPIELNDPRLDQLEGTVSKTGAFPDCVNDFGVYDMVGNLHEWTSDPNGTFQGGYWLDTELHGEACAYRTIAHDFGYHDYSTGFRCCAPPSTP
jgi:sulfatase modifying factor 1